MATDFRVKIGSATIASVASSSTVPGTRAAFGDATGGFAVETSPDSSRIPIRIHIEGTDNPEMLDRTSDILDLLDAMNVDGVAIEMESGVAVVDVARTSVRAIRYESARRVGDTGMIIDVTIIIEHFDADIIDGRGTWQYQRNASGRGMVVARLTAESRAAVVSLAQLLKSGASRPAWLSSAFKPVEDTNEFEYSGNGLATESSYAPAEITVMFEQLPSWAASDTAFADVVRMEVSFEATSSRELDIRAGNEPGLDVSITGRLTFKTEANTSYDASDTGVVASSALHAKAVACVQSMIVEAARRLGVPELTVVGDLERTVTGEDGIYQFAVPLISGGTAQVLEWEEDEIYERVSQDVILDIYDGSHWVFGHPGGFAETISHTLSCVSLGGARGYVQPQGLRRASNGKFKLMREADRPPKILRPGGDGVMKFRTHFEREYRLVRGSGHGGPGRHLLTTDGIPSGLTA